MAKDNRANSAAWECRYILTVLPEKFKYKNVKSTIPPAGSASKESDIYIFVNDYNINAKIRKNSKSFKLKKRTAMRENGFERWITIFEYRLPMSQEELEATADFLKIKKPLKVPKTSSPSELLNELMRKDRVLMFENISKTRRFFRKGRVQLEISKINFRGRKYYSIQFESKDIKEADRLRRTLCRGLRGNPVNYVEFIFGSGRARSVVLIDKMKAALAKYDKPANRLNYQRFFKEKLEHPVGLKTVIVRKVSNEIFKEIRGIPAKEIFDVCDDLLASGERYMPGIAFEWALKVRKDYVKGDFGRFESWLLKYIDNWAACDSLCGGPLGHLIEKYPDLVSKTTKWARSRNRWLRRASAVCLIVPVKNGHMLENVFKTANLLLTDEDDMVQKGYGWMLKEAGNVFPNEVFAFVMKNRRKMPRTALRYAIEKYPPARRKQAMSK